MNTHWPYLPPPASFCISDTLLHSVSWSLTLLCRVRLVQTSWWWGCDETHGPHLSWWHMFWCIPFQLKKTAFPCGLCTPPPLLEPHTQPPQAQNHPKLYVSRGLTYPLNSHRPSESQVAWKSTNICLDHGHEGGSIGHVGSHIIGPGAPQTVAKFSLSIT